VNMSSESHICSRTSTGVREVTGIITDIVGRNHRRPANIRFVDSVVVETIAVAVSISVSPPETHKGQSQYTNQCHGERQ